MTQFVHVSAAVFVAVLFAGCRNRPAEPALLAAAPAEWRAFNDLPPGATPPQITQRAFDQVQSSMTLRELTELLGPGWLRLQSSGTGTIRWACRDGRDLAVTPVTHGPDEIIRVDGGSGGIGRMSMTDHDGTRAVVVPAKKPG